MSAHAGAFERLVATLVRPRTAAIAALFPLLLAVAASVLLGEASRTPSSLDSLPRNADSTVAASLQQQLPDDAAPAVVLFTADGGELAPGTIGALGDVVEQVRGSLSLGAGSPVTPSQDGTAALV